MAGLVPAIRVFSGHATCRGSACTSCRFRRDILIAATLPQLAGFLGSRLAVAAGTNESAGEGEFVLAGVRVNLCASICGMPAPALRRHDSTRISCAVTASADACHRLIQAEGFRLVLLQRIALAVAAQADHLAQMIEA